VRHKAGYEPHSQSGAGPVELVERVGRYRATIFVFEGEGRVCIELTDTETGEGVIGCEKRADATEILKDKKKRRAFISYATGWMAVTGSTINLNICEYL